MRYLKTITRDTQDSYMGHDRGSASLKNLEAEDQGGIARESKSKNDQLVFVQPSRFFLSEQEGDGQAARAGSLLSSQVRLSTLDVATISSCSDYLCAHSGAVLFCSPTSRATRNRLTIL